jgi:hypothetical protein
MKRAFVTLVTVLGLGRVVGLPTSVSQNAVDAQEERRTAQAADLTKIDRSIRKEPTYKGKPKYCLLVWGPEAKTRIWLVQDGNLLYIDRNRDGDLTDEKPIKGREEAQEYPAALPLPDASAADLASPRIPASSVALEPRARFVKDSLNKAMDQKQGKRWCPSCVARSQISRENTGLGG